MADGIYLAMAGATARSAQLDSVADNLANAQTPGFKASRPAFQAFLSEGGAPERQYVAAIASGVDLKPGPTVSTGNPLDVLPGDDGFLAVRQASGAIAFTRNGKLSVDASGQLLAGGQVLLSQQGLSFLIPPGAAVSVAPDGLVSAGGQAMERLATFQLVGAVDRLGSTLLAPGVQGQAIPIETRLRIGEVELGNASALDATVAMISAQRHFEAAMQALQTYKTMDDRTNTLGKVG